MSGVVDNLNTDSDFLGLSDEFTDENLEAKDSKSIEIFDKIENRLEPSFDTLPLKIQRQALDRLDLLKYVERRLPPLAG